MKGPDELGLKKGSQDTTVKVSVIIPTYNRADLLPEAIDSVLAQTWKEIEIIVVDDGSTDRTEETVRRYDDRVRYFYKENGGPSSARNFGVSKAHGDLIAFLDSDDMWEPNKLDIQMNFLHSHPEVELISCGSYVLGKRRRRKSPVKGNLSGDLFLTLYQRSFINTSSVVLIRHCFLQVGQFDETIQTAEDYDLWLRVARRFPMAYLDQPLVGIRRHLNKLSKNKLELRRNAIQVLQKQYDPKRVPERIYRRRLADLYIYLGREYLGIGDSRAARASFRDSMGLMPFRFRSIRYFLRAFLAG